MNCRHCECVIVEFKNRGLWIHGCKSNHNHDHHHQAEPNYEETK